MARGRIRSQQQKETWEPAHDGAIVGRRTAILGPMLAQARPVATDDVHVWGKCIGLEASGEHNHVGRNDISLLCLYALGDDLDDFDIG